MNGRVQKVWLNGVEFSTVHPALLLQHINEGELKLSQRWTERPGGGQILNGNTRLQREITIEFAIRDGRDYARRMEAFTAICAWAQDGGWLEVSDRPGKRIRVELAQFPVIGKLRDWAEDMAIHFTAGWYPLWEECTPAVKSVAGSSGNVQLIVPGNTKSHLAVKITSSSALSSIVLGCDATNTEIRIAPATAIAANTEIKLGYDENHLMYITAGGAPIMRYRSGADDIILNPGACTVRYALNAEGAVQFLTGGAWL